MNSEARRTEWRLGTGGRVTSQDIVDQVQYLSQQVWLLNEENKYLRERLSRLEAEGRPI